MCPVVLKDSFSTSKIVGYAIVESKNPIGEGDLELFRVVNAFMANIFNSHFARSVLFVQMNVVVVVVVVVY